MRTKTGAIILGGDFQGLGVLRTLAKKYIPTILTDSEHCIGKYSKFQGKFVKSPPPSDRKSYLNFLINLAKGENINKWVVFPNSDDAVYVLSKYKNILQNFYTVPTPDWDVIKNVYIKKNTYLLAEKHNIPIPQTYYPTDLEELLDLKLQFPVVIKPSIRDNFYNKVKIKAFRVNNKEELIKTYQSVCSIIKPSEVLVQEFIPGGPRQLYSFCPFFKNGKVMVSITARRTRQHPMDFGHASTFVELVQIPQIEAIAKKILSIIGYYGIAEVEFMLDERNGNYKLLEINPRVWGWHTLAIAAGVDFPYILYQDMIDEPVAIQLPLNAMKWIRLTTDIPTVLIEIFKSRLTLSEYLKSLKGKKTFAVFDMADPGPFLAELILLPYLWKTRGF